MTRPTAEREPAAFIAANMQLAPASGLPEIQLYRAHPGSGLWRLVGRGREGDQPPPYWAYHWAGGTVLARHILDQPETVRGLRVLDLGAGSGVVGIAAAKAGAAKVIAVDIDPNAIAAIMLNASENGVTIETKLGDLTGDPPPDIDLIAVGDLFYAPDLAVRVTGFLEACVAAGIVVLVGDPNRAYLPRSRLRLIAEYAVPDFGDATPDLARLSAIYAFEPVERSEPISPKPPR